MKMPTLLELAESGAHFGHHRSLTYPKARKFVYMVKNSVALIDLEATQKALVESAQIYQQHRAENKIVLFVGTKRSVRQAVKDIALAVETPYVNERWLGGFLTNFETILANITKMNELVGYLNSDKAETLEKKDRLRFQHRLERYQRFLGGVATLTKLPDLMVVASASEDKIAIAEARQVGIPVIALTDTDVNPDTITYPIPANDDAPRAVALILQALVSGEVPAVKAAPAVKEAKKTPVKSVATPTKKVATTKKSTTKPVKSKLKTVKAKAKA